MSQRNSNRELTPGGKRPKPAFTDRLCIGCGKVRVLGPTFCDRCREIVNSGGVLDDHDYVTVEEYRRAWPRNKPLKMHFGQYRKRT